MKLTGDSGRDITAEILSARLKHTVEQHLKENGKQQRIISEQEQELNEQRIALETQAQANTQQAQLLQRYQTLEETTRKAGLVKNLMQGLSKQEHGIVTDALKAFSTDEAKPQSFITFSRDNNVGTEEKPESYKLDFSVKNIATDLTGGNLLLADRLVKFILDYNNLPATKLDNEENGSTVYEFEQRRDTQAGDKFSLRNVKFALPELTEGEKVKGSPVISLDGVPCLNDAQKQAEIDNRKTVFQQIQEKVFPPMAALLIGGLGVNSLAPTPVKGIPDLLPNYPPAEIQHTAQKETLTTLSKNVSGALEDKYPGYKALPQAHRQYIEQHVLTQSGAVNDVKGYPHSLESVQDTASKQGEWQRVTFPIPNPADVHRMLSLAFGNPENLNETVPQYTMTQGELTNILNGNN